MQEEIDALHQRIEKLEKTVYQLVNIIYDSATLEESAYPEVLKLLTDKYD